MSAFLCSDLHTACLALAIVRAASASPTVASFAAVARGLRKVNNRALKCRYNDRPVYIRAELQKLFHEAASWIDSHSPADLLGAARCFQYQCAEGDALQMKEAGLVSEALQLAEKASPTGFKESHVWSI